MTVGPVRVLVVDDSAFMRKVITALLESDPEIKVVGQARNGLEAVRRLPELSPDVITMDLEMPQLDGLHALGYLMAEHPTPVIMLSAFTKEGAEVTLRALDFGAVDFVCKPSGTVSLDMEKVRDELIEKVKAAATANLKHLSMALPPPSEKPPRDFEVPVDFRKIVAIGCSTGGPRALAEILPQLPGSLPAAVVIVQHMSQGFTKSLAERLDSMSQMEVREAEEGDPLRAGRALLAPGNYHMEVIRDGGTGLLKAKTALNQKPQVHSVRPSADVLLESVGKEFGPHTVGVVLTGMGHDGAKGLGVIRKNRGKTLAQDEASCVVYGMPKAAVESGAAQKVVPLSQMAQEITRAVYEP